MTGTSLGSVYEQFAACRQPPYGPEGGDAGARLRDAGRRLWPCPQCPAAGAHLYKYNSGTGNWDDYTRLLNRTIAACTRAREERSDVLAREILEIADAPCADQVAVQRAQSHRHAQMVGCEARAEEIRRSCRARPQGR